MGRSRAVELGDVLTAILVFLYSLMVSSYDGSRLTPVSLGGERATGVGLGCPGGRACSFPLRKKSKGCRVDYSGPRVVRAGVVSSYSVSVGTLTLNRTVVAMESRSKGALSVRMVMSCCASGCVMDGRSVLLAKSLGSSRGRAVGRGTLTAVPMGAKKKCGFVCASTRVTENGMLICRRGFKSGTVRNDFREGSGRVRGRR